MVHSEAGEAAHSGGVSEHRHVEPADASRSAGDRAVLSALVADVRREVVLTGAAAVVWGLSVDGAKFGRERAGADAGEVRLDDADDLPVAYDTWTDASTDRGGTCRRVRGGDIWVDTVVDVDRGSLGPLEHDVLT
jgi:hypothetical protein